MWMYAVLVVVLMLWFWNDHESKLLPPLPCHEFMYSISMINTRLGSALLNTELDWKSTLVMSKCTR